MHRKSLFIVYVAFAVTGFVVIVFYNLIIFSQNESFQFSLFMRVLKISPANTAMTIVETYLVTLVFSIWVFYESKRQKIKWSAIYVLLCFAFGLALTLPLFLAVRERALEQKDEADIIKELFKYKYVKRVAKNDSVNKQQYDSTITTGEVV